MLVLDPFMNFLRIEPGLRRLLLTLLSPLKRVDDQWSMTMSNSMGNTKQFPRGQFFVQLFPSTTLKKSTEKLHCTSYVRRGPKLVGCPVTLERLVTKPNWKSNRWKAPTSVIANIIILEPPADEQPAETIPQSNSQVFNAGGPVWGLDWCPLHPGVRERRCDGAVSSFHF